MIEDIDDLTNRFTYHKPHTDEIRDQHDNVRALCLSVARSFAGTLPAGRERALALTKLEEAMFWANAAIARQP